MVAERRRAIRSFVRREGRITLGQRRALAELWPIYGVDQNGDAVHMDELFGRHAPTILEIGCGNGEVLVQMAAKNPQYNYLGVEVYRPGVGSMLLRIDREGIKNARVFAADAQDVLEDQIPAASLDRVLIFFPDPWPKKRHHKRRLIQAKFLTLISTRLQQGGEFHVATDWEDYANHVMELMTAQIVFENVAGNGCFAQRPAYRPPTKYERRGQSLGHPVRDMVFRLR